MKINSLILAVMIFLLLFGGIGFTTAMNWWQTESTKVPAAYTEGEAAGQYNPADIRGSYTFGQVSELFAVPLTDLQAAFRLPQDDDPAAYPLKSLESQFADLPVEMGTGSVRMFVAFYKGLPFELSEDEETYLFSEAAEILKAQNKLRPEQAGYLEAHTVLEAPEANRSEDAASAPLPEVEIGIPPAPTEHSPPEKMVTGKTTFQDLLDWGLTPAAVEGLLGKPMPHPQTVIKDYLSQEGMEFSPIKTSLQQALDHQK